MEAGNMFGTAQAAPDETPVFTPGQEQQQQPPAQEQQGQQAPAEQQAAQTETTTTEQGTTEQTPEDPTLAAINELRQKVEGLAPRQHETDPNLDLLTALSQEPEEPAEEQVVGPQAGQDQQQTQQAGDPEAERQLAALEQLIDERAEQMVQPLRAEQVAREMQAVQQRNPDIMEPKTLNTIAQRIGALEARTGAEGMIQDPQMVETMYKLVKAEAAESTAVAPAEVGGAALETNAGQSQAGSSSFADDYKQKVFGSQSRTPSVFG